MKHQLNQNLGERYGVTSNLHGFLMRHFDTGFKSKWSGYWSPPYKFLDYYAIKVNGIWLDSENLEGVEYGRGMVYHFKAGGLRIEERVTTPDSLPGFRLELEVTNIEESKKAAKTSIEPAVDIRPKSKDVVDDEYELEARSNRLTLSRNGRKLMISADRDIELKGGSYQKEHFPGERQVCMIPGRMVFREELEPGSSGKLKLDFTTSEASFSAIDEREQEFENPQLGQSFGCSINSMLNLVYDRKGLGLIAGHPWFQNYWSRDTYWTLLGLIDAGYFEVAHEILENFADTEGFPDMIPLEDIDPPAASDPAPLYVIAADKLERHWKTSEKIKQKQEAAFETLELENGVVQHDPDGTWMDTLERSPAVDIQSLWLKAAEIMGHDAESDLRSGLREFEQKEYVKDHLGENPARTVNPAVPLMFGQFKDNRAYTYLEALNAEFSSRFGARTRAVTDPGYEASGYHTGSVWGLTTGWAAAANLRYGKNKQGINFLEKMAEWSHGDQVCALPEALDAETGELIGCGEQAWSAGMFVHVIDRYLLGIEVKEEHVEIDPVPGVSGKRLGKRIGDETIDLEFENGEVEVLNNPESELIIW